MMVQFKKVQSHHKTIIFEWLDTPHVKAFWDNSEEHRNDIVLFMEGRKTASPYFDGVFTYWIGYDELIPFCLVMTSDLSLSPNMNETRHLSTTGNTSSLDFMIGNAAYVGKGLAADTLKQFMDFMRVIDPSIDAFIIDPSEDNPRAKHVYEKAGFQVIDTYMAEKGYFKGDINFLMKKTFWKNENE